MGNTAPLAAPETAHGPINFMRGWPHPALLPVDLVKSAADAALSNPAVAHDGFLYGPDPGYQPCREAVADWLTAFYRPGRPIAADRLCITGGASQNLGCMLGVYSDPAYTRHVWVVAPAYMLAFRIFEDAGFADKLRAVPEDDEGIDLAFLRRGLRQSEDDAARGKGDGHGVDRPRYKPDRPRAKVYKHLIYCVPNFSNPSSRTMSRARREALVRLAREFDALILPDDVYDFLQWPAHRAGDAAADAGADVGAHDARRSSSLDAMHVGQLPRLVDIDRELDGGAGRDGADGFGNACSNGSFSKIAGPGLRVGWVEGTEKFAYGVSQTGTTASGGAPSQLTSTYVTHLLRTGQLQRHIHTVLQPAYLSRYSRLVGAIDAHLRPLGFRMPQPDRAFVGGYFVWLALPAPLTANALARRCRTAEDVIIAPGPIFEVPDDEHAPGFDGHMRLCFAWEDEWKLDAGVRRIARVATAMLDEARRGQASNETVESGGHTGLDEFK